MANLINIFIYLVKPMLLESHLKLSKEENLLITILFLRRKLKKNDFEKIDYYKMIKIAGNHLILPTLYLELKSKKYLKYIPKKLVKYLEYIYQINLSRNNKLLNEVKKIEKILNSNKIKFLLLKGAYIIKNSILKDLGSRMIGDIDILINKKDIEKIKKIVGKKLDYHFKKTETIFWKKRHLPRLIKSDKEIGLEMHTEILEEKKTHLMSGENVLLNFHKKANYFLMKICILNFQINDFGAFKGIYSYRNIYDFMILSKNLNLMNKSFNNKYFKRYFIITNLLGITNIDNKLNIYDKFFIQRFILKKKWKLYYLIDDFICKTCILSEKRLLQIGEFLISPIYRKYVFKKIKLK